MSSRKSIRPQVLQPFSEADVKQWNEALRMCEDAIGQCQLGIQAGFPCQDQESACTALRDQIAKMKAVYAPGFP